MGNSNSHDQGNECYTCDEEDCNEDKRIEEILQNLSTNKNVNSRDVKRAICCNPRKLNKEILEKDIRYRSLNLSQEINQGSCVIYFFNNTHTPTRQFCLVLTQTQQITQA